MALSGVDDIGVIGTGITAFSFFQSLLPGNPIQGATVRIYTSGGNNPNTAGEEGMPTGGDIDNIYDYNFDNTLLGSSGGGHIG